MNFTERSAPRAALSALSILALAACSAPGPRAKPTIRSSASPISSTAAAPASAATASAGDPDQRFQEALGMMKAHQYPEAQAAFIALSRDYPAFSGPLTDLGILYAQGHQHELAVASLTRAVNANPDNAVAHNWLGTLHREGGDFVRAEQSYRKAISVRPDYAQAHLNLAILYDVALHKPRDALAAYREYQRLAGKDDLLVAAWIRDLETRLQPAPSAVRTASVEERMP
jgi:tetratricopeptide (TPR) repeat protein